MRAAFYPANLRVHTDREMLMPYLCEILRSLESEPDIRSSHYLIASFFQHLWLSSDLTSIFKARRNHAGTAPEG